MDKLSNDSTEAEFELRELDIRVVISSGSDLLLQLTDCARMEIEGLMRKTGLPYDRFFTYALDSARIRIESDEVYAGSSYSERGLVKVPRGF